jgi:hypothetical protein
VVEGFFNDIAELEQYAADLAALEIDRRRRDIAWRLGLGEASWTTGSACQSSPIWRAGDADLTSRNAEQMRVSPEPLRN